MARAELNSEDAPAPRPVVSSVENDAVGLLWRGLNHPLARLLPLALLLFFGIAGVFLIQMPGQLNHEPATAARWLVAAANESGSLGELWRGLDLYNVRYHPLLQMTLALLALSLAVRFAASMGIILAHLRWIAQSRVPVAEGGLAVQFAGYLTLQRRRFQVDAPPDSVATAIENALLHPAASKAGTPATTQPTAPSVAYADPVIKLEIPYRVRANPDPHSRKYAPDQRRDEPQNGSQSGPAGSGEQKEHRFVIRRNGWLAYAPAIRDGGLLLATLSAWSMLVFGWSVTTPVLPPGEGFQSTSRGLSIRYPTDTDWPAPPEPTQGETPVVEIRSESLGAQPVIAPVGRAYAGTMLLDIQAQAPGLLLSSTQGELSMRRLGQAESTSLLGIVLDEPNREETVLLPELAAGLRIARRGSDVPMWLVEYYGAGDVQPRARWEIDPSVPNALDLPETPLVIHTRAAAGLQTRIDHMPGRAYFWTGLLLAVLGGIASLWPPLLAIIQIAPWYNATVVTIQATHIRDLMLQPIVSRHFSVEADASAQPGLDTTGQAP